MNKFTSQQVIIQNFENKLDETNTNLNLTINAQQEASTDLQNLINSQQAMSLKLTKSIKDQEVLSNELKKSVNTGGSGLTEINNQIAALETDGAQQDLKIPYDHNKICKSI